MPYSQGSKPRIMYRRARVAKPNYNFEKRQREIAKKKKKEEKRLQKAGANESQPQDAQDRVGSEDKTVVSVDS
jgi:hypothetical protein